MRKKNIHFVNQLVFNNSFCVYYLKVIIEEKS